MVNFGHLLLVVEFALLAGVVAVASYEYSLGDVARVYRLQGSGHIVVTMVLVYALWAPPRTRKRPAVLVAVGIGWLRDLLQAMDNVLLLPRTIYELYILETLLAFGFLASATAIFAWYAWQLSKPAYIIK